MKRIELRLGVLLHLLLSALLLVSLSSCELLPDDDEDGITAAQIAGTWMSEFGTPYAYDPPSTADVAIFTFSGNNYELMFYKATVQVGGNRGTFTIKDNALVCATATEWNDEEYWIAGSTPLNLPISLSGDLLNVIGPSGGIVMKRTTFSRPSALADAWVSAATYTLTLASNGTYTYDAPGTADDETGSSWDTTGTDLGYLRSVSSTINGAAAVRGRLIRYTFNTGYLTLSYPSGDLLFQ